MLIYHHLSWDLGGDATLKRWVERVNLKGAHRRNLGNHLHRENVAVVTKFGTPSIAITIAYLKTTKLQLHVDCLLFPVCPAEIIVSEHPHFCCGGIPPPVIGTARSRSSVGKSMLTTESDSFALGVYLFSDISISPLQSSYYL